MDATAPARDTYAFDAFRVDSYNRQLVRLDDAGLPADVPLGSRALDILIVLLARHGELVSKEEIMDAVWPGLAVEENNLTVQISAIRRAIDAGRDGPSLLQTVPRRGYRFVGEVTLPPAKVLQAEPPSGPAGSAHDLPKPLSAPASPRWWVGRTAPLQSFERSLRKAFAGSRQVVFVTGEAGIGKTTLIEMATDRQSGRRVGILRGRCAEVFGAEEAFLPLIDALTEACRDATGARVVEAIRTHAPTWLLQMPALLALSDRAAVQADIFGATRERMLREFCELMEVLSEDCPWILVLEDLHWSDVATVNALSRLARGERTAAVLVLASYRPPAATGAAHPAWTLHQDLQIHGRATDIVLDRLSLDEVEHYLLLRFGNPGMASTLAEVVFARTHGQPLFVTSLVDSFVDQQAIAEIGGGWCIVDAGALKQERIPRDLRAMIMSQIDQLAAEDQHMLEIASAAGVEFAAALVAAGVAGDLLDVERVLERLARRGHIVTAAGTSEWPDGTFCGSYGFQHALYQEVLYSRLSPSHRVQAHRRLGVRLETAYGAVTGDVAPVLAVHFEEGREFGRAVHYFGQAAASSVKRLGNREAVNYLTRALIIVDRLAGPDQFAARIALLRQRGWARRTLGDLTGSVEDLNTMIAAAAGAGELRMEVNGLLTLGRFCLHADRRLCLEATERAVARSRDVEDGALQFLVRATSASTNLYLKGWREDDAEVCRQAIRATADARDHGTLIRRYGIESILECSRSRYLECSVAATRGKALAQEAGDVYTFVLFNVMQSTALLHLGEWRLLQRETAAARALAERNANRPASALCRLTMAWLHAEALDFEGARARCESVEDRIFEGNPFAFFFQRAVLAKAFVGLGQYEQATLQFEAIDRKLHADDGSLDFTIYTQLCHCRSEHGLAAGDLTSAREQAALLYEYAAPAPDRNHLALAHQLRARIAAAEGDTDTAAAEFVLADATLGDAPPPLAAWRVYQAAAEFYAGLGSAAEAAAYRDRYEATLQTLAAGFDADEPLRASLQEAIARSTRAGKSSPAGASLSH